MAQTRVMVPVVLRDKGLGQFWFFPQASKDQNYFESSVLIKKLVAEVPSLKKIKFKNSRLSFKKLNSLGFQTVFDQDQLVVVLDIKSEKLSSQNFALAPAFRFEGARVADDISGKINFRLNESLNRQDGADWTTQSFGNIDSTWNLAGQVLAFDFQFDEARDQKFYQNTIVTSRDLPGQNLRIQLGDIDLAAQGFQRQIRGGGIQLGRIRELRAFSFYRGTERYEVLIQRASLVEVFLNGQLIKRLNVRPGPLSLEDFPFARGQNEVKIRVTENSGNIREFNLDRLYEPNLLKSGVLDFDVGVFFPSSFSSDQIMQEYETSTASIQGYILKASSDIWNFGGNWVLNPNGGLLGVQSAWVSGIGIFRGDIARSHDNQRNSFASGLNFQTLDRYDGHFTPWLYQMDLSFFGREYKDPFEPVSRNLRSRIGQQLAWRSAGLFNASIGGTWTESARQQSTRVLRLNIGQNWTPSLRTNLEFQAIDPDDEIKVIFGLSWFEMTGRAQFFSRYQLGPRNLTNQLNFRPNRNRQNREMTATHVETAQQKSLELQGQQDSQRVQSRLNVKRALNLNSRDESSVRAYVGTALAFAGGKWAISRPIGDSFVMVDSKPEPTQPIGINSQAASYEAKIDNWGPAVLSDSQSYAKEYVSAEVKSLKLGSRLAKSEYEVGLAHFEGRLVELELIYEKALSMRLVRRGRGPLRYSAGEYYDDSGRLLGEFFTNSEGRIYLESLNKGVVILKFFDPALPDVKIELDKLVPGLNTRGDLEF